MGTEGRAGGRGGRDRRLGTCMGGGGGLVSPFKGAILSFPPALCPDHQCVSPTVLEQGAVSIGTIAYGLFDLTVALHIGILRTNSTGTFHENVVLLLVVYSRDKSKRQ